MFLGHLCVFFGELSLRSLPVFKSGCLFIVELQQFFIHFQYESLRICNYPFHSMAVLSTFLIESFEIVKFLILMMSNFSIFSSLYAFAVLSKKSFPGSSS